MDQFVAMGETQAAELRARLRPVDPAAVAPYLGRYAHPALGEVELALQDGRLVFDAGEVRSELRGLADEAGQVTAYAFADPPLARVLAAPVILRRGADGRPEVAVAAQGEGAETYVLTPLAPNAAATPAP